MKVKISNEVIEKYPNLNIGIIAVKSLDNNQDSPEVKNLLKQIQLEIKNKFDLEKVIEIPVVVQWRSIYKSFGAKPSEYRSSIESLLRRIAKKELPNINPLVNIYNYISLKYLIPVGGEDADQINGDLILDFALGAEEFVPLGSAKNESPWPGEVVYKDNQGIICRCWNWRESDRAKLNNQTQNAIIVMEILNPQEIENLKAALMETEQLIKKFCGGSTESTVLNRDNLEININ
jgi:lysyl-tRNA synthetase class 2